MRKLVVLGTALFVAALVAIWMLWWSAGPKAGPHSIIVAEGSSLAAVARELEF